MPKISTFLNDDTIQNLKEISNNSGKSVSKIMAELIEIGYGIKYNKDAHKLIVQDKNKQELVDRNSEYLMRILATVNDIHRCTRNENSRYQAENESDVFQVIKTHVAKEIDHCINKEIKFLDQFC